MSSIPEEEISIFSFKLYSARSLTLIRLLCRQGFCMAPSCSMPLARRMARFHNGSNVTALVPIIYRISETRSGMGPSETWSYDPRWYRVGWLQARQHDQTMGKIYILCSILGRYYLESHFNIRLHFNFIFSCVSKRGSPAKAAPGPCGLRATY